MNSRQIETTKQTSRHCRLDSSCHSVPPNPGGLATPSLHRRQCRGVSFAGRANPFARRSTPPSWPNGRRVAEIFSAVRSPICSSAPVASAPFNQNQIHPQIMQTQLTNRIHEPHGALIRSPQQSACLQLPGARERRRLTRISFPLRRREQCLTKRSLLEALRDAELHEWLNGGDDFADALHQPIH